MQLQRGVVFVLKDYMKADKLEKAPEAEEAILKHLLGRMKKVMTPQQLGMKWANFSRTGEDVYDLVLKALKLQEESRERGMHVSDLFLYEAILPLLSQNEKYHFAPESATLTACPISQMVLQLRLGEVKFMLPLTI